MNSLSEIKLDSDVKELNFSADGNQGVSELNILRGNSDNTFSPSFSSHRPKLTVVDKSNPTASTVKEVPLQGLNLLADPSKMRDSMSPTGPPPIQDVKLEELDKVLASVNDAPTSSSPLPLSDSPRISAPAVVSPTPVSDFVNANHLPTLDLNENKSVSPVPGIGGTNISTTPVPLEPSPPPKTAEQIQQEKQELLFKFERIRSRGIPLSKQYTITSDLQEMKVEYDRLKRQREIENSVKFQRKVLIAFCSGLEFLNGRFDPLSLIHI